MCVCVCVAARGESNVIIIIVILTIVWREARGSEGTHEASLDDLAVCDLCCAVRRL